ncbi:hypothetical protein F2Q70_00034073 [Brassica cretica]|uniref:GAT domain-containing protein n=1 Tax=Brassica cretica TaxID=69181 RepID=A0A8S9JRV7_BRACR|nr:hypothetical protein F2Q70_00034073 [Brassica cretica]
MTFNTYSRTINGERTTEFKEYHNGNTNTYRTTELIREKFMRMSDVVTETRAYVASPLAARKDLVIVEVSSQGREATVRTIKELGHCHSTANITDLFYVTTWGINLHDYEYHHVTKIIGLPSSVKMHHHGSLSSGSVLLRAKQFAEKNREARGRNGLLGNTMLKLTIVQAKTTKQSKDTEDITAGLRSLPQALSSSLRLSYSCFGRSERSAPVFTPPQTQPLSSYPPNLRNAGPSNEVPDPSAEPDFPTLSLSEIQNAKGIMDVLAEMLSAIEPGNREDLKQEVMVDLVEQCRTYKQRVVHLVNSSAPPAESGSPFSPQMNQTQVAYTHAQQYPQMPQTSQPFNNNSPYPQMPSGMYMQQPMPNQALGQDYPPQQQQQMMMAQFYAQQQQHAYVNQMGGYGYGYNQQQQGNSPYLEQQMHGMSIRDQASHQVPPSSSSYLPPMKPKNKPEDKLFGDLVDISKFKPSTKPTSGRAGTM